MDINQLSAILGNSAAVTGQLGAGLSPAFAQVTQGITDAANAQVRATEAKGTIATEAAKGQLATQRQNLTAASALGTNMADAAPLTIQIQQLLRTNVAKLNQQQAVVSDIEANNDLFTNPAGFLRDLLVGDGERAKLQALQDQTKTASDTLQMINQATQQTAATNRALTETVTDASVLAMQEQIKAESDLAIAESKQRLGSTRVEELRAMQSFNSAQASQFLQLFQAQAMDEQRAFTRSQRFAADEERKQQKATDEELLAMRNSAAQNLGLPVVTNLQGWRTTMQLNKEREDMLLTQGARLRNGAGVSLGDNPIEAMARAQALQVPLSEPQQQLVKKSQMLTAQAGDRNVVKALYPELGPQALSELMADKKRRPEIINKYMSQQINTMRATVDPQNPTNLYAPAPLGTLKDQPYMKENKFLNAYILPSAVTSPNVAIDGGQLAEFSMDAIKKGVSTSEIAEGISFLGAQLVNQNNLMYNYQLFGLPIQESLRIPVAVKGQGFWSTGGFTGVVDITKPTEVERMLAQVQAEMVKRERSVGTGGTTLRNMFP